MKKKCFCDCHTHYKADKCLECNHNHLLQQKFYFSSTDTLDAWTGGGFFRIIWQLDIFRWRICIWELPKMVEIKKG